MLCFSVLVFSWCAAFEQSTPKMLFVIDSIPLIHDPEEWNQLMPEDIAEISVLSNKDSLNRVGWGELDGITYIFTKAYRERPDSLKRIPSLKQMVMQNGAWHLDGRAYTGPYIDYLYNGRIQDEGNLRDGKLNGQLTVYYINGAIKSVTTAAVSFLPMAVWMFLVDRHEANTTMNAAKKNNLVMILFFTCRTKSTFITIGHAQYRYFFPSHLLNFLNNHLCDAVTGM